MDASVATRTDMTPGRLFIGGRWRDASDGAAKPTINPAAEEATADIAQATAEDVEEAVRSARTAFDGGLADALEATLLLSELDHRVANAFQAAVSALELRAMRLRTQPEAAEAVRDASAQLQAFACAHRMVTGSGADGSAGEPVELGPYLAELGAQLQAALLDPRGVRLSVEASGDLCLPKATARRLGLVVHELVANAAKHAFPRGDGAGGHVLVTATAGLNGSIVCTVQDDGAGLRAPAGLAFGQGLVVAQVLAQRLGGTCAWRAARPSPGTEAVVTLPVVGCRGDGAASATLPPTGTAS